MRFPPGRAPGGPLLTGEDAPGSGGVVRRCCGRADHPGPRSRPPPMAPAPPAAGRPRASPAGIHAPWLLCCGAPTPGRLPLRGWQSVPVPILRVHARVAARLPAVGAPGARRTLRLGQPLSAWGCAPWGPRPRPAGGSPPVADQARHPPAAGGAAPSSAAPAPHGHRGGRGGGATGPLNGPIGPPWEAHRPEPWLPARALPWRPGQCVAHATSHDPGGLLSAGCCMALACARGPQALTGG